MDALGATEAEGVGMNRAYRIHVVLKATFERKATRSAKEARAALLAHVPEGWTVEKATIHSIAKPKVSETLRQHTVNLARHQEDTKLAEFQEIANRIAAPFPTLTRPKLEWKGNRYCHTFSGHLAHAHIGRGKWGRGQYRLKNGHSRPIPRGLICLDRKLMQDSSESVERLLAHEIAHLKSQRGNRATKQHDAERTIFETYKYGAPIPILIPDWFFVRPVPEAERCEYPKCENRYSIGWSFRNRTEPVIIEGKTWYRTMTDLRTCDEYLHKRWGTAWSYRGHRKPSEIKGLLHRRRG